MAPKGWLDVHCHFYTWNSDEERKTAIKSMQDACFMVNEHWNWTVEDSLASQDKAGVQMQMLSYLPQTLDKLKAANNYAASIVKRHPTRFGMLCALPTDQPEECFKEIDRAQTELHADGFAVSAVYKDVMLGDPRLEPVWSKLNDMGATVFIHPNAYAPPRDGRPAPLIEVAFETTRVAVDMLYRGIFKRFPSIKFVFSHCGGALPVLSGRLELLGAESWVPNPEKLTREGIHEQLSNLWLDCAATAETGLQPAIKMVGSENVVYGTDCGVPCSTQDTMERNKRLAMGVLEDMGLDVNTVGRNGWTLFPSAAERVEQGEGEGS